MEVAEVRFGPIKRALDNLKRMIDRHHYSQEHADQFILDDIFAHRESKIQRFEICMDLFWKCLKQELHDVYGVDVAAPKKAMQECFKQKIITADELESLLIMVDDRNATTHMYDETFIVTISDKIDRYYSLMNGIIAKIERGEMN